MPDENQVNQIQELKNKIAKQERDFNIHANWQRWNSFWIEELQAKVDMLESLLKNPSKRHA